MHTEKENFRIEVVKSHTDGVRYTGRKKAVVEERPTER